MSGIKTKNNVQSLYNSECLMKQQEQVKIAFSESERKNDEKILKITTSMINQTVASILQVELQNDKMVKEMINSIPGHNEKTSKTVKRTYAINQISPDLAAQLK